MTLKHRLERSIRDRGSGRSPSQTWLLCASTVPWEEKPGKESTGALGRASNNGLKPGSRGEAALWRPGGAGQLGYLTPLTGYFQFPMELNYKSRESVTVCCLLGEEKVTGKSKS